MFNGFDLSTISAVYVGSTEYSEIYLGSTKIWPIIPTVQDFSYTGAVQSTTLPKGTYKLQCWGAQGGSNPAYSTYGITSQAGGKGGYSEGILTLTSPTTLYIFVGGQPSTSSTNGGWNGGGGGSGVVESGVETDTYGYGYETVGRGGGATDIALTTSTMSYSSYRTNRSSASLLSRFIVAGGGSGGVMSYNKKTNTEWQTIGTIDGSAANGATGTFNGHTYSVATATLTNSYTKRFTFNAGEDIFSAGDKLRITLNGTFSQLHVSWYVSTTYMLQNVTSTPKTFDYITCPSSSDRFRIQVNTTKTSGVYFTGTITIEKEVTTSTSTTNSQVGYAGGGIESKAGSSGNVATQTSAGNGGGFGYGRNQRGTDLLFVGGCAGGGWYGGGASYGYPNGLIYSGGGSGFVNIAANAQYRPSGFTGIKLDTGATYDGNNSNPATTEGSYETGHSGNGYARITRMGSWQAKLPDGYTEVEYIENTSSAYINTEVNAADDIGIHVEYYDNSTYGSVSNYVTGARNSANTILYAISGSSTSNTTLIAYNSLNADLGITRTKGRNYVADLQANSSGLSFRFVDVDNNVTKTGKITSSLGTTTTPIYIFGIRSTNVKTNTRIKRYWMTKGGTFIKYYIPCISPNNVVGLYDCVNNVFKGSDNSNKFTAASS